MPKVLLQLTGDTLKGATPGGEYSLVAGAADLTEAGATFASAFGQVSIPSRLVGPVLVIDDSVDLNDAFADRQDVLVLNNG